MLAVASGKGSPGATTLALALAGTWPAERARDVVVVEADPDGGSLTARFRLGFEPGLVTLAAAARRGLDEATFERHLQPVGGAAVLCGPDSAEQAHAALDVVADRLARLLAASVRFDTLVDVGRLSPRSAALPLAQRAARCLLVVRPRLDEVQHLAPRARALTEAGCVPALVCVGERPYRPEEVAAHAGIELAGVVADDRRAAAALCGTPSSAPALRRSLLWRTSSEVALMVAARLVAPRPADVRALDAEEVGS